VQPSCSSHKRKSAMSLMLNLSFTRPHQIFYEQVAGALAFFPDLESFELSGMYWTSSKKPDQRRIWQSQPFNNDFVSIDNSELYVDLYSNTADFFFS
jgi:hypothetical protein